MDRGVIRGRADAGKAGRAGARVSAGLLSTDTAFLPHVARARVRRAI